MENGDPDGELVGLARAGDVRAFEALVVKYQRRIARHVARYVRRASDVEDVVQEAFIRAYRGLASFRGDSAFYSWLYRIATNVAINMLKREDVPILLGDDAPEERAEPFRPGVSDNEDPERRMMASQTADAVQRALDRLQPELAEPLMLFEVEGKVLSGDRNDAERPHRYGAHAHLPRPRVHCQAAGTGTRPSTRQEVVAMTIDVSKLLDGQLESDEVRPALDQVASQAMLRDRYTVYALVGDVLRGNSTPDDGFSVRIFERMRSEQTRIEPGYDPLED